MPYGVADEGRRRTTLLNLVLIASIGVQLF